MKEEFQILPVVRESVDLKKRGNNYLGLCPFHKEKTPSFTVSEPKNIFKCFGCGKGGSAVQFQMLIDNTTFEVAYNKLLNKKLKFTYTNETLEFIIKQIYEEFQNHTQSVLKLMNFDRTLVDFCIQSLENLEANIQSSSNEEITNLRFLPTGAIRGLENIRKNDSMKLQYEAILNQCVVLLVSYFSTSIKEIFRKVINYSTFNNKETLNSVNDSLKLSLIELSQYDFDLKGRLGEVLISKTNISFQDMKSISSAFKKFLSIELKRSSDVNTIIISQAARHCIVHTSEIADEKFFYQLREIDNMNILTQLKENEKISFDPEEIEIIINSMNSYIENLIDKILTKLSE